MEGIIFEYYNNGYWTFSTVLLITERTVGRAKGILWSYCFLKAPVGK